MFKKKKKNIEKRENTKTFCKARQKCLEKPSRDKNKNCFTDLMKRIIFLTAGSDSELWNCVVCQIYCKLWTAFLFLVQYIWIDFYSWDSEKKCVLYLFISFIFNSFCLRNFWVIWNVLRYTSIENILKWLNVSRM